LRRAASGTGRYCDPGPGIYHPPGTQRCCRCFLPRNRLVAVRAGRGWRTSRWPPGNHCRPNGMGYGRIGITLCFTEAMPTGTAHSSNVPAGQWVVTSASG